MIDLKQLAANLKAAREKSGTTQSELARTTGISRNTIFVAERTGNLKLATLYKICRAIDVTPHSILPPLD